VFLRVDKLSGLAAQHPGLEQESIFRRGAVALVKVRARQPDG